MIISPEAFYEDLSKRSLGLDDKLLRRVAQFAAILHRENEEQNLTRITGVEEFYFGHLIDVLELHKLPGLGKRVLDIGSGSGVPGLLAACIDTTDRIWFLSESEKMKADYLKRSAQELGLSRVAVLSDRAEVAANLIKPDTVIARAVGTVEKIAGWISNCSTWNNLILFKSRGWEEEWKLSSKERFGKKLTISHSLEYSSRDKYRLLVTLIKKK